MAKAEIESDYVEPAIHKPRGVTELIILEEFKLQESDYGKKYAGKVQTNGIKPEVKIFRMNNTSAKTTIRVLGDETLNWINKKLSIKYVEGNTPGGLKDIIYVDEIRTRELNFPVAGSNSASPNSVTPPTV